MPETPSNKKWITKDSGNRQEFPSGAVRDIQEGKGRYDLISPFAIKRLAGIYERGAKKYSLWHSLPCSKLGEVLHSCTCKIKNQLIATQISLIIVEDFVELVMNEIVRNFIAKNNNFPNLLQFATQIANTLDLGCVKNATGKILIPENLLENKEQQTAIQKNLTIVKGCVENVMRDIFDNQIRISQRDSAKIAEAGIKKIKIESKRLIENIIDAQKLKTEIGCDVDIEDLLNLESPLMKLMSLSPYKEKVALFAEEFLKNAGLTWTTIIKQTTLEDYSALHAIRALAYLEIVSRVFSKHSPTCKLPRIVRLNPKTNEVEYYLKGERNWEKGINLSRFLDSAFRHLYQFLEGKTDEDHAGQAAWNIIGLIHTEEMIARGLLPPELNDLPSYPIEGEQFRLSQQYRKEQMSHPVTHNNRTEWRNEAGQLHRDDGPAIEYADGSKLWYKKDKLHRLDGPAIEWANGTKEWYKEGKLHRLDGPACEWANGSKLWYIDGVRLTEEEFLLAQDKKA